MHADSSKLASITAVLHVHTYMYVSTYVLFIHLYLYVYTQLLATEHCST